MDYIDFEALLLSAGLNKIKKVSSNGEYKFCCPYHNDKGPSAQFNVEKGVFRCFGCGQKAGYRSFFEYIGVLLPTCFQEVVFRQQPKEFDSYESFLYDYESSLDLGFWLWNASIKFGSDDFDPEVYAYIEGRLYHPQLESGFVMPIGCGYHKRRNSIIFRTRFNIVEKFLQGRYVNYGDPAHLFTDCENASGYLLILVEGVFDWLVLRQMEAAGYPIRSASMLGTSITDVKLNDIAALTPKEVCLAFDNDKAGHNAFKTYSSVLTGQYPNSSAIHIHGAKDFGDMCYDDIAGFIEARTPIMSSYNFNFTY